MLHLVLGFLELHKMLMGPLLKLVQVPLDVIPFSAMSVALFSFVSSADLLRVHSVSLSV